MRIIKWLSILLSNLGKQFKQFNRVSQAIIINFVPKSKKKRDSPAFLSNFDPKFWKTQGVGRVFLSYLIQVCLTITRGQSSIYIKFRLKLRKTLVKSSILKCLNINRNVFNLGHNHKGSIQHLYKCFANICIQSEHKKNKNHKGNSPAVLINWSNFRRDKSSI